MWNESLFNAVKQGDIADILLCIENGANVNFKYERMFGWTPLICCAEFGYFDIAKLLIANGADTNIRNNNDMNPLMVACLKGNFEIVKLLVENGADVNYINKHNYLALWLAKTDEISDYLITKTSSECVNLCLMFCVAGGNFEKVKYLIENGADVNAKNKDGTYVLDYAKLSGNAEIMKLLVAKGANKIKSIKSIKNCCHCEEHEA